MQEVTRPRTGRAARSPEPLLHVLDSGASEELLRQALADAHYRPVARAAELAAAGLYPAPELTLICAVRRLAEDLRGRLPQRGGRELPGAFAARFGAAPNAQPDALEEHR